MVVVDVGLADSSADAHLQITSGFTKGLDSSKLCLFKRKMAHKQIKPYPVGRLHLKFPSKCSLSAAAASLLSI